MHSKLVLIICVLVFTWIEVASQPSPRKKENLEEEKRRLEEEVKLTNKLLEETRKIRKQSSAELQIVNSQIQLREQIVYTLHSQVKNIDQEIENIEKIIQSMQKDILKLKQEYLEFAYSTYKNHNSISILLWLFSSESFSQAYTRLRYFKDFSEIRKNQIQLIRRAQVRLMEKKLELENRKNKKNIILNAKQTEYEKLIANKKEKQKIAESLRKQESYYKKQLNIQRQNMQKIQSAIEQLVLEEKKAEAHKPQEEKEADITAPLSKLFEKNKGKLPWPVSMNKGVITGRFGISEDEVSGAKIMNNGIYITTSPNENVRAVFGGKVTAVQNLPMLGKVVIIQHGNYRTVYANLNEVFVKVGDEVEALTYIGNLKLNSESEQCQLHFLIYEGKTPLNPEQWIMNKR
ncbi:MAG: peptidase M23 [Bacteroidia bacterium]|nr:MAG: peptidase M23 [Bacteroidia bacterium]